MPKPVSYWIRTVFAALGIAILFTPQALAADDSDSLYAQIEGANRKGGGTIVLTADIFLSEALPPITSVIFIDGADHSIFGGERTRIFDVDGGGLTLTKLILNSGQAPEGESGGLVRLINGGTLIANESSFKNGKAQNGGAIATLSDNVRLTINRSSFAANAAAGRGGALSINGGSVTITNSAFLENTAVASGGGIEAARGQVEVVNSTLDNNEARDKGGAVSASGAETILTHLTLSENLGFGGGDGISRSGGSLLLRNSIISGRSGADDCIGDLDENDGNLISDGACAPALRGNAMLGLRSGAPAYRRLEEDSPAINAALAEYCPATDQVGNARPIGAACDIGAFESQAGALHDPPVPPPPCRLHDQILAANSDERAGSCPAGSGHDIIILTGDVTLDADLPPITSSITIEGAGYAISGERTYRIFDVEGGALTVNNLTLRDASNPHDYGGAIKLHRGARVSVYNAVFEGNQAGWGGAIATNSSNDRLTVNNSRFVNNAANSQGAASLTRDRHAIIAHAGGALIMEGGVVDISNSSFQGNRADFTGGAIDVFEGRLSIANSTFSENLARDSGGGAISIHGGDSTLTHLTLLNNSAYIGGGIYRTWGVTRLRNSIVFWQPPRRRLRWPAKPE